MSPVTGRGLLFWQDIIRFLIGPKVKRSMWSPCLSQRTRTTRLTNWHTRTDRGRLTFTAARRQFDRVLKWTGQHRYLSPLFFSFRKRHRQVAFDTYLKYQLPPPLHKCNRTIYFLDWRRAFHVGSTYVTLICWPIRMQHNLLTRTNQIFAQVTVFRNCVFTFFFYNINLKKKKNKKKKPLRFNVFIFLAISFNLVQNSWKRRQQ